METPKWLTERGGSLKLGSDRRTWFVIFSDNPQYALEAVPAGNQFGFAIRLTINGQRIESKSTYAARDDALRGGLEHLCRHLGWC